MPAPPNITPLARVSTLLTNGLALIDKSHPAYPQLHEAMLTVTGLDPYLEAKSSPLIVPESHKVSKEEVYKVWDEQLSVSESTDWTGLYKEGKTTWELNNGMCSGAYEATVLQQIALDLKATTALEIGLFTGTTTLALGLLPDIKKVVALDIEPFLETFDRPYWERAGVSEKIVTRFGPAAESLKKLKAEGHAPFDVAFIDADKPSYETYVRLLLDLELLSPGGVILADNTLYKGYVYNDIITTEHALTPSATSNSNNRSHGEATQGIIDFNDFVRNDPRLIATILPVRDGVTIIRRKI
ncbi:S-adenosyl-L-methionine-dependent methyltransferase [Meredithblackwellia eburnea MCA 4105]